MVGGTVIEVAEVPGEPDRLFVDCRDGDHPLETCAIYVARNETSLKIELGDTIWWQSRTAYWTPQANRMSAEKAKEKGCDKQGVHFDIQIPRIGYSGVQHPSRK